MPFTPPPEPTITTPTAVMHYMVQVDGEIVNLNADVNRQAQNPRLTNEIIQAYNRFKLEWTTLRDAYIRENGWLVTPPGDAWVQTAQVQAKNEDWRGIFARIGIFSTAPAPHNIPRSSLGGDIKDLLITGAIVAGIGWALWKLV